MNSNFTLATIRLQFDKEIKLDTFKNRILTRRANKIYSIISFPNVFQMAAKNNVIF